MGQAPHITEERFGAMDGPTPYRYHMLWGHEWTQNLYIDKDWGHGGHQHLQIPKVWSLGGGVPRIISWGGLTPMMRIMAARV